MFYLHRQKTLVSIVLLFIAVTTAIGQNYSKQKFQPEYDAKKVRFGYFLGVAATNYKVKYNNYFLTDGNTEYFSVNSPVSYGLKMGGLVNFNLNPSFDFRILPTVAIYSRRLDVNNDPEQAIVGKDKAWFELPLMLKYKSLRRGNYRAYMFAGCRLGFETNALNLARKTKLDNVFTTKTADFSLEYGAGLEFFQRFFKLSPELHFSHGMVNLVDNSRFNQDNVLGIMDRLSTHTVTVYLLFE